MKKQNFSGWQERIEKKYQKKDEKKRKKMKVSGAAVKKIQEIIKEK